MNTFSKLQRSFAPLLAELRIPATGLVLAATLLLSASAQQSAPASTASAPPTAPSTVQKRIEAHLRDLYALGPDVQVTVGPPKDTAIPGLSETSINVKMPDGDQTVTFYVSRDGKYLIRGELSDLTKDPFLVTRSQIDTRDAPTLGDPNAPITLVEYSDFECPVCRGLHDVLRGLLPKYPQVRVIFKDFPIEQIHPWARTAALAGRCAYNQDHQSFWKMYDLIYDNQEVISAENVWTKVADYAAQSALNADTFKDCLASPATAAAVDASRANGNLLNVSSTPTVFVNGRRMVGADAQLLEQYIKYELASQKKPAVTDPKP
ncbi:MAG: hypothetical protein NVS9B4_11370 [Candidatus Acidiferrum sp.]